MIDRVWLVRSLRTDERAERGRDVVSAFAFRRVQSPPTAELSTKQTEAQGGSRIMFSTEGSAPPENSTRPQTTGKCTSSKNGRITTARSRTGQRSGTRG